MAAGTGSEEVSLNVYDLSNGLAAQLSMAMVGTHFPAIYHTGARVRACVRARVM